MAYLYGNDSGNTIDGTPFADWIYGYGGNDHLYGYGGNDTLNGGTGDDLMVGGIDDDTYVVDSAGDVVLELANQGADKVIAYISISDPLDDNVEKLYLYGVATTGTGNALDNVIEGNGNDNFLYGLAGDDSLYGYGGNDTLDGGTGADYMRGGAGDDIYIVNSAGDIIAELANEGTDRIDAYVSDTLNANVENLNLYGTATIGVGNTLDNVIVGNDNANSLYGLDGNDSLYGDAGNDILYGNTGNDHMYGGTNNDTLNGGTGDDYMAGGSGDDAYTVDSAGDVVFEAVGAGTDRVNAYVSDTLDANVENLYLYGTAINGYGNALDNVIAGNSNVNYLYGNAGNDSLYGYAGNDILNGAAGNDKMYGGADNDTYYIDSAGDVVLEAVGAGTDRVNAYVSDTLDANVENLYLYGTATNGYGNALDNVIAGNSNANTLNGLIGNDTLYGYDGNDSLYGSTGNDKMYGGNGQDRFAFGESGATNRDVIGDFSHGDDTIMLRDILDGIVDSSIKGLSFTAGVLNEYFEGAGYTGSGTQESGIYNDTTTGNIWYNPTSGTSGDSVVICTVGVATAASLDHTDFVM
jgi:Ca2+-binding RTX toxin-like protein